MLTIEPCQSLIVTLILDSGQDYSYIYSEFIKMYKHLCEDCTVIVNGKRKHRSKSFWND